MKVINFFGGPGVGKSTAAAELFVAMKQRGYNVELVTEYAKQIVWEGSHTILQDQLYLFAKQNRRLERLRYNVDYAITDSPLLLVLAYAPKQYYSTFRPFVDEVWNSYENLNILLRRHDLLFNPEGRVHTLEESRVLDLVSKTLLEERNEIYVHSDNLSDTLSYIEANDDIRLN